MSRALSAALAIALLIWPRAAAGQPLPATAPLNTAGPNGPVTAIARAGDTLFIGGDFDRLAVPAPGLAVLATANGAQRGGANVTVEASLVAGIPAGGWIVAGRVTGGGPVRRLARFDASGVLDQSWNVDYDQFGSVTFLAVQGSAVLIGGNLRSVNGVARTSLAAVDATTGAVLPWNPKLASALGQPVVSKGLLHQGRVFLYGQFDQVNNQAVSSGFAVVDATSAALLPITPPPGAAANVQTWAAVGDSLFVLTGVPAATAGQRLSISSGVWTAWLPAGVSSLATAGSAVFGWSSTAVVELDPVTATPRGQPFISTAIAAVVGGASRLFVVRANNHEIVALSATNPATEVWRVPVAGVPAPTSSNPLPFPALGVAENGGTTAVWGRFSAVGGDARPGLFALDLTTGAPTPFAPLFQGRVSALVTIGGILVVGGELVVGGQATGAVAVDVATGQILSWRPPFTGKVSALAVDSRALYFAGDVGLATLSLATLGVTSRQPFNGVVRDLAVTNGVLIAGGDFTLVDGAPRNGAAALAGTPPTLTPWDPAALYVFNPPTNTSVSGTVTAVATAAGRIAISGLFTQLGGVPAQGFGVFDANGARLPFALPAAFTRSNDVASDGSRFLVAARRFVDLSPDPFISDRLVLLSAVTGQTLGWSPEFSSVSTPTLSAVALYPDAAVVAGEFSGAGGRPVLNLAVFPIAPRGSGAPTRLRPQVSGSTLTLGWAAPTGVTPPIYRIDAAQGGTPIGSFALAGAGVSAPLSPGVYSLVVRAETGLAGVPTWPVVLTVPAPAAVPATPLNLTQAAISTITGVIEFAWRPGTGGGNVDSFVIEAGTQSGAVNIGVIDTGVADTTFAAPVPPGTYFVRVRAKNAVGLSAPSNEIVVVVTP